MNYMTREQSDATLRFANELAVLAKTLEATCATWAQYDLSQRPQFPSPEFEARKAVELEENDTVWQNAISAGRILCELRGLGALKSMPRILNALGHVEAEMEKAKREGRPPIYYFIVNLPYRPKCLEDSYDVFYVKLFETFNALWAESDNDRRAAARYYVTIREKATFHVKMMRSFAEHLKLVAGVGVAPT